MVKEHTSHIYTSLALLIIAVKKDSNVHNLVSIYLTTVTSFNDIFMPLRNFSNRLSFIFKYSKTK